VHYWNPIIARAGMIPHRRAVSAGVHLSPQAANIFMPPCGIGVHLRSSAANNFFVSRR
jgi:hypothetical protein